MTQPSTNVPPRPDQPTPRRLLTGCTILFGLFVIIAALIWIISAGTDRHAPNFVLDKDSPVPRIDAPVAAAPQNVRDVLMAGLSDLAAICIASLVALPSTAVMV